MVLRISGETFTLESAWRDERNILLGLRRSTLNASMYDSLWSQRKTIQALVASHLGLSSNAQCVVEPPKAWVKGKFNVCVFLQVEDNAGHISRKVFRCPIAHKVGDHEDAVDEKIRAEVANYVWVEENCPEIPTPRLIGFGFGNNSEVSDPPLSITELSNDNSIHMTRIYHCSTAGSFEPLGFSDGLCTHGFNFLHTPEDTALPVSLSRICY